MAGRAYSRLLPYGLALVVACGWSAASAQSPPTALKRPAEAAPGPSWQSLSGQQRSALAPLQNDWSSIDPTRKAKWLNIAGRFPRMSPDEQGRMQDRMTEWARLSPQERARARVTYQEAKQLPNQERQERWKAYQALPESQRQALAKQAGVPKTREPEAARGAKRNIVTNPSLSAKPVKPVAPTVVQAAPGATTTLVTRQPAPPAHQQAGMPKIAATPVFVDRTTLLPKRGPQGASVRAGSAPAGQP